MSSPTNLDESDAILWYQGKSDANVWSDADSYDPSILIIQVALAFGEGKFVEMARREQLELGMELTYVKCVDARGLQLKQDRLHLTTASQVRLSRMLADAFVAASK